MLCLSLYNIDLWIRKFVLLLINFIKFKNVIFIFYLVFMKLLFITHAV